VICRLLLDSGLRISEVLGIQREDIDPYEHAHLRYRQGQQIRTASNEPRIAEATFPPAIAVPERFYSGACGMKSIDKSARLAEIANGFSNIAYREFPSLILDQLTMTRHVIHL